MCYEPLYLARQPIAAAVDELLTSVKRFGRDTEALLEALVRGIGGAGDVQRDQLIGAPQLRIVIDRSANARYGLNVDDVQAVLGAAVGGRQARQVFEEVRRFDIVVRYVEKARASLEVIRKIIVHTPRGEIVPLSQLVIIDGLIFFVLFMNFGFLKSAGLIMLSIPLALVGGIVGMWLTGQNLRSGVRGLHRVVRDCRRQRHGARQVPRSTCPGRSLD